MFIAPAYSFSRPANTTQYAQNELVANNATAGLVVPMRFGVEAVNGKGRVNAVRFFTDNQNVVTATFNLHLFTRDPGVPSNGDNGAFGVAASEHFLGTVACDLATGAFVTATDKHKRFAITGGLGFQCPMGDGGMALYGLIETATGATYTPASEEVFKATLEIEG